MRAYQTLFVILSIFSASVGHAKEMILSSDQNVQVIKQILEKSRSLKVEIKANSETKEFLQNKNFDLNTYLLTYLVNDNILPADDATVRVAGVTGICTTGPVNDCSLKVFNSLYYKTQDSFKDKVGDQILTIDFKAKATKNGGLNLVGDKVSLSVEFQ